MKLMKNINPSSSYASHSNNSSLTNNPTASQFLCKRTSKILRLMRTSPQPVNYFRSANRTRFRASRNIFDFYCFDRNSDSVFRLWIWGSYSHISYRISFNIPNYIFYWLAGMKKYSKNRIFSQSEATRLTKMPQNLVKASRSNLPSCLNPITNLLARCISFFIYFWQNQLYCKKMSQFSYQELWLGLRWGLLGVLCRWWIFIPISYYRVGDFVKFFPFIAIFAGFCWDCFSSLLYSSMMSWIVSFFLMLLATCYLEEISLSLGTGKGTTLPNLPFLTLNILSMFKTFNQLGLLLAMIPLTLRGMKFLPQNLALKVLVSRKGLDHFIYRFICQRFFVISLLSRFILCFVGWELWISCENFLAFRLFILVLIVYLLNRSMEGSDMVLFDNTLSLSLSILASPCRPSPLALLETTPQIFLQLYFLLSEKLISLD